MCGRWQRVLIPSDLSWKHSWFFKCNATTDNYYSNGYHTGTTGMHTVTVSGTSEFATFYNALPKSSLLRRKIEGAMDVLKQRPVAGEKIQIRRFPPKYVKKYGIRNLFRYSLGSNYRILYTIAGNDDVIQCIILDALSHKEYDSLFGYHTS